MGYETRLYVVSEHKTFYYEDGKVWAEVIGMFDLCNVGGMRGYFTKEADGFIFASDGNTHITEDRCGDSMKSETPERALEFLEKVYNETVYWRALSAYSMIKSISEECDTRDNVMVYWYGY